MPSFCRSWNIVLVMRTSRSIFRTYPWHFPGTFGKKIASRHLTPSMPSLWSSFCLKVWDLLEVKGGFFFLNLPGKSFHEWIYSFWWFCSCYQRISRISLVNFSSIRSKTRQHRLASDVLDELVSSDILILLRVEFFAALFRACLYFHVLVSRVVIAFFDKVSIAILYKVWWPTFMKLIIFQQWTKRSSKSTPEVILRRALLLLALSLLHTRSLRQSIVSVAE